MGHGDNRGIIIPPKIAPIQIDIIEIQADKNEEVKKISQQIYEELSKTYNVRVDKSNKGVGFKAAQSEIEGVPIRIEIGPRDLQNNQVLIVRRDTIEKQLVEIQNIQNVVKDVLTSIHDNLYKQSQLNIQNNTVYTNSYEELKKLIKEKKFVVVPIVENLEFEKQIKEETFATPRCIAWELPIKLPAKDQCIFSKKETNRFVLFARAY